MCESVHLTTWLRPVASRTSDKKIPGVTCYIKMKLMKRGGYSCAMKNCSNISGRESGPSFFRFPKDPDRAKLWLEKCGREINTSPENLYKNYKVCGDHFKSSMFLNDLKNRLQPHAIPEQMENDKSFELSSENNATFNLSDDSEENTVISVECDIIKSNYDKQQLELFETGFSDKVECQSILVNDDHHGQYEHEQVESVSHQYAQTELQYLDQYAQTEPQQLHQYSQTEPKFSNHSPRKRILRGRIEALHREIRKLKQQLERQKNKIQTSKIRQKMSLNEYCEATDEFLPPEIANFVKTQVRLSRYKSAKGRKYSLPFKKFCLDILFSGGGRIYNSFAQKFILPSLQASSSPLEKYCILCIDEASIKANLYYNISQDEVIGFEDLGDGKSYLPACNVAVLMIRGICNNWKQPLAYFFLHSSFSARKLTTIIPQAITKLQNAGFIVVAFVSDMGGNFKLTAKYLGVTENNPFFFVNNERISHLFDSPHIIKAVRNNFHDNIIEYDSKPISWKCVDDLFQQDQTRQFRLAPKLTDKHMKFSNFDKMKVYLATQILSFTVSSSLRKMVISGAF
ncbi:uncharacterized protein LOC143898209 isoform X2 [Temnothorax americanus]|uniref:uncharacterized protein LOC143898209 isoform X2 n=1 Tax=Temnothorax americanus TaxID=1964332 RepID=UPI004068A59E